jgi:cytochrome bd-type quinol oxidase subunit 2
VAEVVLAATTVFAVLAVATAIPALLRTERGKDARSRLTPSLAILTGGAAITFAAYLTNDLRCGHRCDRGAAPSGIASFHRWWHRHDSWQWSTQLTIAAVGLAIAALAFAMAARRRPRARTPLWVARFVYAGWVVLVFAIPAAYEVVRR